jgi:alpha-tubulin suppressor-like RCC1 family protein
LHRLFSRSRIVGRIAGASVLAALGGSYVLSSGCSSASTADALGEGDAGADATFGGSSSGGDDAAVGPARDASTPGLDAAPFNGLHCTATPCAIAIATGGGHACAVLDDHTVRCWGQNASGELGSGAIDGGRVVPGQTPIPVGVPGLTGVTQVAAGGYGTGFGVSCAIGTASGAATVADGGAVCWGSNADGMLGLGAAGDAAVATAQSIAPLPLALTAVAQVALGGFFGCALLAGGNVSCWGDDSAGELGRLTDAGSFDPVPAPVPLPGPATAVATGKNHACALMADRSVVCWGAADHGAIGTLFDGGVTAPQTLTGLTATALAAGEVSTCAITIAGTVACWGGNQGGQLGRGDAGTASIDPTPQAVTLPAGLTALQIASAVDSTCALMSDRSVWCWGDNAYGELGTGSAVPGFSSTPAPAQGLSNIVQIASGAGGWTVCALLDDGSVRCWGANFADQLGVDTSTDAGPDESPHPVPLRVAF